MIDRESKATFFRIVAFFIVFLWMSSQAFAWGGEGHRVISGVAASKIPADMPAFLRTPSARSRIDYLASEPDRWRNEKETPLRNAQDPDHYIDLERVEGLELPRKRYDFYRMMYERRAATKDDALLPERVGTQPYAAIEVFDRLESAFRDYRRLQQQHQPTQAVEENIVFYAGWLGHYVGDGSNPLHTTIKHEGWRGENPNGYTTDHRIHYQMETEFVDQNLSRMAFADLVRNPVVLRDPFVDYLKYLRESHTLVEKVYQLEKAGGFRGEGTAESREFIRRRLVAASQMLLNLWYTAWVQSAD